MDLIIVKYPKPHAIYLRGTIGGSSGSLDLDKQVLSYRCSSVPENLFHAVTGALTYHAEVCLRYPATLYRAMVIRGP